MKTHAHDLPKTYNVTVYSAMATANFRQLQLKSSYPASAKTVK